MLQRPSGNLVEWIQDHLGPLVVAFFVFVLPAIRAALASKKQEEEAERPRGGQVTWKDLLEGRTETQTPPPIVPVPPQRPPPEPEFQEEESLEDNPPPQLVELPSVAAGEPEEDEVEAAGIDVQPASTAPVSTVPPAAPPVRPPVESWLFPTAAASDRREAMRRAIVLREVLGPPLALR